MVVPAMQLASKIPDMSVQLWSSALLRGKVGEGLNSKRAAKSLGLGGCGAASTLVSAAAALLCASGNAVNTRGGFGGLEDPRV